MQVKASILPTAREVIDSNYIFGHFVWFFAQNFVTNVYGAFGQGYIVKSVDVCNTKKEFWDRYYGRQCCV